MHARRIAGLLAACALAACTKSAGEPSGSVPATQQEVVVFAWNDLGMHCLNPTYDTLVVLPPYNTIWAQVVRRAATPALLTTGVTVEYRLLGNTTSYGKRAYGGFWDNAGALFGPAAAGLPHDYGLDVPYPADSFTLTGQMKLRGTHFEATGVPVVPVSDAGAWNPYQVIEIAVKDGSGAVVAATQATVPTSDEMSCDGCHAGMGPTADAFTNVLALHDQKNGTTLSAQKPVLCGGCHATPALGIMTGAASTYVSEAIHGFHGALTATQLAAVGRTTVACYDCHPGPQTQCSRSTAHLMGSTDGNCTHCHGSLSNVGATITAGRVPWVSEPSCATQCHAGVAEVDTGATLYRNAAAHGGIGCPACHGSPHAMVPSRVASDNAQAIQYQGKAAPVGDCLACHASSRGGDDFSEFPHAGPNAQPNSCFVCHTQITADTTRWPHQFQWKARSF